MNPLTVMRMFSYMLKLILFEAIVKSSLFLALSPY